MNAVYVNTDGGLMLLNSRSNFFTNLAIKFIEVITNRHQIPLRMKRESHAPLVCISCNENFSVLSKGKFYL